MEMPTVSNEDAIILIIGMIGLTLAIVYILRALGRN